MSVISAAARLLLNEMQSRSFETELYPTNKEILSGTDFCRLCLNTLRNYWLTLKLKKQKLGKV